ncbi:hypothetical protein [Streptomyces sp. NPDC002324]
MTGRANRHPGTCGSCATHVPAGAGTLVREQGRWVVLCAHHPTLPDAPVTALFRQRAEEERPSAEVRVVGTPDECEALVEALRNAPGVRVTGVSDSCERRDPSDSRTSVYVRAEVAPGLLAVIQREREATES